MPVGKKELVGAQHHFRVGGTCGVDGRTCASPDRTLRISNDLDAHKLHQIEVRFLNRFSPIYSGSVLCE